jgi:hypothetical protein
MSGREISILRRRHDELGDATDERRGLTVNCMPAVVVVTYAKSSYPTVAGSYYACHPVAVSGTESEGSTLVATTDTTQTLYVLNLGTAIPPAGTKVIAHGIAGRWEMTFSS